MKWPMLALAVTAVFGCQSEGDHGEEGGSAEPAALETGPVDGFDLPPTDLERVAVGDAAPLFTLDAYHGGTVSLSDFQGEKNVVLVFYRGHW